jgi:hypothetical protein
LGIGVEVYKEHNKVRSVEKGGREMQCAQGQAIGLITQYEEGEGEVVTIMA